MKPFWDAIYAHGPAIVINGHNHIYERFAPMDPDGKKAPETQGIQEFVVCPGGAKPVDSESEKANGPQSEKFQGGTGVNLTPPPATIIAPKQIDLIKMKIEQTAKALGIQGYARIDLFFNLRDDRVLVIEANSLPGLTPSTVIYHQALAEVPPMNPQAFLSKLVELGMQRRLLLQTHDASLQGVPYS